MNLRDHKTGFGERVNHVLRLAGSSFPPPPPPLQSLLSPPYRNNNIPDTGKFRYAGMELAPLLDTPGAIHCEPVMARYSRGEWLMERMMHACEQEHLAGWSPEELRLKWIIEKGEGGGGVVR